MWVDLQLLVAPDQGPRCRVEFLPVLGVDGADNALVYSVEIDQEQSARGWHVRTKPAARLEDGPHHLRRQVGQHIREQVARPADVGVHQWDGEGLRVRVGLRGHEDRRLHALQELLHLCHIHLEQRWMRGRNSRRMGVQRTARQPPRRGRATQRDAGGGPNAGWPARRQNKPNNQG